MVMIADIGNFDSVPPVVTALLAGDRAALDALLVQGWDIEANVALGKRTEELPLMLACAGNAVASVHWLVEHGAQINRPEAPGFALAARYCGPDLMRYLAEHGADIHARRAVGGDAYQQALYGKKIDNLAVIDGLGHSVAQYGGEAFRSAVFDRNGKAVAFFLAHGVDVNFSGRDQVFPDHATPLMVATRNGDAKMCRLLVEHGADVTMTSRNGDRPYTIALELGDEDLAAYFRGLEPPDQHNLANALHALKPYKLSADLLDFLQGDQRRIEVPDCGFGFVEFFALVDAPPMKAGRQKVLRVSRVTGDFSDIVLVWNPKSKRLGYWDIEHEEYADIAPFADFLRDPALYLNQVLDGDLAP